jgi:hypothetical protein
VLQQFVWSRLHGQTRSGSSLERRGERLALMSELLDSNAIRQPDRH